MVFFSFHIDGRLFGHHPEMMMMMTLMRSSMFIQEASNAVTCNPKKFHWILKWALLLFNKALYSETLILGNPNFSETLTLSQTLMYEIVVGLGHCGVGVDAVLSA